jgi:hypothetical protein
MSAEVDESLRELVANWPPLTSEQKCKLRILLRGSAPSKPYAKTPAELEMERRAEELRAQMKAAEDMAAAMIACDVCDLPPVAHTVQDRYYGGYHEWVPGRAEKLMARKGK